MAIGRRGLQSPVLPEGRSRRVPRTHGHIRSAGLGRDRPGAPGPGRRDALRGGHHTPSQRILDVRHQTQRPQRHEHAVWTRPRPRGRRRLPSRGPESRPVLLAVRLAPSRLPGLSRGVQAVRTGSIATTAIRSAGRRVPEVPDGTTRRADDRIRPHRRDLVRRAMGAPG